MLPIRLCAASSVSDRMRVLDSSREMIQVRIGTAEPLSHHRRRSSLKKMIQNQSKLICRLL